MKKIKKILACVTTAVTIITGGLTSPCKAIFIQYDLENPEYQEYVSNLNMLEGEIAEWIKDFDFENKNKTPLRVYANHIGIQYEYIGYDDNSDVRRFSCGFIACIKMPYNNNLMTKEEINEFLQSEGIDATVPSVNVYTSQIDGETYISTRVECDEDTRNTDKLCFIKAYYALCLEYGFEPVLYFYADSPVFEDVYTDESTLPSFNFGTPTIADDIDLNNEQGTADIIVLSKYIANSQLYPITDPTALANADMNQDKEVNSLDANILVEMSLGDYENIV